MGSSRFVNRISIPLMVTLVRLSWIPPAYTIVSEQHLAIFIFVVVGISSVVLKSGEVVEPFRDL